MSPAIDAMTFLFFIPLLANFKPTTALKIFPREVGIPDYESFSLDGEQGAVCLDGSHAGGYMRVVPGSQIVLVTLEGGGYCDSFESCKERVHDQATGLGSSKAWTAKCPSNLCSGIASPSCAESNQFCNVTSIFLKYCSGDRWLGQKAVISENNVTFTFAGSRILWNLIKTLLRRRIIKKGIRLVLSGRSMGGVGVLHHLDEIDAFLRPKGVEVRGLLLWAVDVEYPQLETQAIPWGQSGWARDQKDTESLHKLYNAKETAYCKDKRPDAPWDCQPHEIVANLSTPTFVAANLWSPVAFHRSFPDLNKSNCQYLYDYGRATRTAYTDILRNTKHGAFIASCFSHVVPWDTTINDKSCQGIGCSLREVFTNWLLDKNATPRSIVEKDCGMVPCNSRCAAQRVTGTCNVRKGTVQELDYFNRHVSVSDAAVPVHAPRRPELLSLAAVPNQEDSHLQCEILQSLVRNDGYAVLRNVFSRDDIEKALRGASLILDQYEDGLIKDGVLARREHIDDMDERAIRLFGKAPKRVPKYFRKEIHHEIFFDILAHPDVVAAAKCLLRADELRLYPVYMYRINVPGLEQNMNSFHQDSMYTYAYFKPNASANAMERFMESQINFWAPFKDVDKDVGTLAVRRNYSNKMASFSVANHSMYGKQYSELRVDKPDLPDDEIDPLYDLKAGDLVVFPHYTPHRGLPNTAKGRVRYSMDWRLQDAQYSTMRPEDGCLVQSDYDSPIMTRSQWTKVKHAPRWSERSGTQTLGQNKFKIHSADPLVEDDHP
eukprot:gnl/TRDRNA2_/TRDRNA2_176652_c0_seq2.p1 gnl/TRDRNA2_/TRDRNA2_176652_c0~~gnl/TRDRNA2_/TRDRNA2_176652_c0_seq2.p1  ORF type:complete len:774 (-),score=71.45 gnl/TRDRNA2_/TRDRNA2_176652_c0_seq2:29-2350(-)